MQVRRRALLVCLAATLLTGAAAPRTREKPDLLLREAMDAPQTISYVGEVQTMRFGARQSEAAIYRIEHRSPDLTRRWYVAPEDLYGDSTISRGDTTYSIDVKRNRVVIATDDAIDDQVAEDDNFGLLTRNYRASYGPDDVLNGRPAHLVILTNKYTGQINMRVWIDKKTKLVLEKEQFAANGSVVAQTRFEHLRYTNDIPLAIFEVPKHYTAVRGPSRGLPSNDLQQVVKTAGFNARSPKYLPEGFLPVEGDVIEIKGVRTLHLLYSDGIRTVSLFQNAKNAAIDMSSFRSNVTHFEGHDAHYVDDGPTTLLAWSEANLHFALVGDLNLNELTRIAASVVP
jgi:negative regulator of sigma E activity